MTRRAMTYVSDFAFNSDFGAQVPPADPADDKVPVSAEDLARLLQEARAQGMMDAEAKADRELDDRLQVATTRLNDALANLVALAGHLEACAYDPDQSDTALRLINETARRIIDGQGDLFAGRKELGATVPAHTK